MLVEPPLDAHRFGPDALAGPAGFSHVEVVCDRVDPLAGSFAQRSRATGG